jgi:hypothetical protein
MIPTHIIVHHSLTKDSGTVSWGAIRKYHVETNKWLDIGYHAGVELVNDQYEVLIGRMWNQDGAHAVGMNNKAVGICFVGNFDVDMPSDAMLDKGLTLIRFMQDLYQIPKQNIKGHCEYAPKSCPGKHLMEWVREVRT